MTASYRRALLCLCVFVMAFGLGCGLCDAFASLNSPAPTTRQVSPSDVATTMTLSCATTEGEKQVTVYLDADSTFTIESSPTLSIWGTWTIEKAEIYLHYKEPVVANVGMGWYIADATGGKFQIIQAVEPEACYWLKEE